MKMIMDFTFHYVSINTIIGIPTADLLRTLHSTMFLLILSYIAQYQKDNYDLYIPLCFY